jgi:hypothetical protein
VTDEKPPLDRHSDAYISRFKPWLRRRIEELRNELERPGSSVEETRGRIAELRDLERLIDPDDPQDGTAAAYFPNGHTPT